MASFTDAIPQFNPYIQQLPVEAMVAVGMEKQKRYDQGLQRIQSQIDQVAGLSIARPQDKEYLQSKLNDLGSKLKTVAAGDFSNYQLVNSVAGMASTIMKDPVIIAGVQSAQNIKNNEKIMEEARQKGELTPDNLDFYNKRLVAYESAPLVDERGKPIVFNAKYDPYFDVFKFVKENFDAVKPANLTFNQVYETDDKGNPLIDPATNKPIYSPLMIKLEKEGRLPEAVRDTLDQILADPRVSKQLQITGEYNYKGYSPEMIKQKIATQESAILAAQNSQIADLTLRKNGLKTQEEKDAVDIEIGKIQNSMSTIKSRYNELKEAADTNTDAVRGYLYENDVRNRYTTMFGQMSVNETISSNPGWEANFKIQQAAEQRQQFYTRLAFDRQTHRDNMMIKELEMAQKAVQNAGGQWELSNMPADFDIVATFEKDYDRASDNFVNSSKGFIWDAIYSQIDGNEARFQKLIDSGNSREQAIDIILRQDAKKQGMDDVEFVTTWGNKAVQDINRSGGVVRDDLLASYNSYTTAKKSYEDLGVIKNQVDGVTASQTDQSILKLLSGDEIKPQIIKFRGQDIQLTKEDIVDLGAYARGNKHIFGFTIDDGAKQAADAAYKRLERNGKSNLADYVLRNANIGDNNFLSQVGEFFGSPGMFNITGAISKVARHIASPIETFRDDWNAAIGDTVFDFSQIGKVFDGINNDQYSQALSTKASVLRNVYDVNPNVKASLFTGNAEADRNILGNVRRLAGAYAAAGQNASSTFDDFSSLVGGITDPKDLNLEVEAFDAGGGQSQFVITAYGEGNKKSSMVIQADEASRFGLVNPYVNNSVAILQSRINSRGGKTSYGNPNNKETYINGDSYFQKSTGDFPSLINSPYNVMANITNSNGMYYGKIFAQDPATGVSAPIFTTPPADLETIYNSLRSLDNNFVRSLISNR
jgi:hypothetical protein